MARTEAESLEHSRENLENRLRLLSQPTRKKNKAFDETAESRLTKLNKTHQTLLLLARHSQEPKSQLSKLLQSKDSKISYDENTKIFTITKRDSFKSEPKVVKNFFCIPNKDGEGYCLLDASSTQVIANIVNITQAISSSEKDPTLALHDLLPGTLNLSTDPECEEAIKPLIENHKKIIKAYRNEAWSGDPHGGNPYLLDTKAVASPPVWRNLRRKKDEVSSL